MSDRIALSGGRYHFFQADAISAEARERGLTDEILEAELAAYNAEHREQRSAR